MFRVEEKGAVDTVHGGGGAGLLDWFPLSQGASECRAKGKLARQTGSDALDWEGQNKWGFEKTSKEVRSNGMRNIQISQADY